MTGGDASMKLSEFQIGQAAKIFGLSPETIRYYERKNIISPAKNSDNGYRKFNIMDAGTLTWIRAYLNDGFSLDEAHELIEYSGLDRVEDVMISRKESLEETIKREQIILEGLKRRIEDIRRVREQTGRFSLETRPVIWCLPLFQKERLMNYPENEELCPKFLNQQSMTFSYIELDQREVESGKEKLNCNAGMAVYECDAAAIGITADPPIHILPSCECLHTCLAMRIEGNHLDQRSLDPVREYLRIHNLRLSGSVFCRNIILHESTDGRVQYRDIWLPVDQSNKQY